MFDLYGIPVYLDRFLVERKQVRFPKTKKKRIRKKWSKRPENYKEFPLRQIYRIGDSIYVHPDYFREWCDENGIQRVVGLDDLLHLTCPAVEERVRRVVEERVSREMSEPLGIFTRHEKQMEFSTESIRAFMDKLEDFVRQPSRFDMFSQPLPVCEWDWSRLEDEPKKFQFFRQDYQLPIVRLPSPLLTGPV